jgi:aryl-alcohol dehydrogenase-like predicted oxidoreductase
MTGKYNEGIPDNTRGSTYIQAFGPKIEKWKKEGRIDKMKVLEKFAADELNCTLPQLGIAWCLKNKNISSVILGAVKVQQLDENVVALEIARLVFKIYRPTP